MLASEWSAFGHIDSWPFWPPRCPQDMRCVDLSIKGTVKAMRERQLSMEKVWTLESLPSRVLPPR